MTNIGDDWHELNRTWIIYTQGKNEGTKQEQLDKDELTNGERND